MMSKTDYEMIAAALRSMEDTSARATAAYVIARACGRANPAFNRDRFLAACDVPVL